MQGSVRKRGDKWYYSFELANVNGNRKRVERVGGRIKAEAEAALREAIREYDRAGDVIDNTSMSVSDYLDYWYKNYVQINLRYNTKQSYNNAINKHIKPVLGSMHLRKLKPAAIQELINQMHQAGYSRAALQNVLGVLTKSLSMAVYPYQYLHENPAHYAKIPRNAKKKKSNEPKPITAEEFSMLLKWYPRESAFHLPLMIGFHTGLRIAEVCGLTKDCIDLEKKTLTVKRIQIYEVATGYHLDEPKTPCSIRTITISSHLVKAVKEQYLDQKRNALKYGPYYEQNDHVCTMENGRPMNLNGMKYYARVAKKKLEHDFSYHSLRHTHASMLVAAGASIKAIQVRLGHARIATTMDTYSHVTADLEKTTASLLEDLAK